MLNLNWDNDLFGDNIKNNGFSLPRFSIEKNDTDFDISFNA